MSIGQIIGFVNLVAGIWTGFAAWQMYESNQRKFAKWPKTTGVVKGFKSRSGDDATYLHPVVEYQTKSGSTISFESKLGSTSWKFGVGSEIEIMWNPRNPTDAEIIESGVQNILPIGMGAISGMMIISAPVLFMFF